MNDLVEIMRTTDLSDKPDELLFNPPANSRLATDALDNIPRYLFRVVSPHSDGITNEAWVHSKAASNRMNTGFPPPEDIFSNLDTQKQRMIAEILYLHLKWKGDDYLEDNLVSWTSSLPFALQYIYYRHESNKDGSDLEDIKLYVIDTTKFPRGTFLRDLDLINAFYPFDKNLENIRGMRRGPTYYFGEYLSQGSLKIQGMHQVVSGASLFDQNRLQRLQPQFKAKGIQGRSQWPPWATEVVRLRKGVWNSSNQVRLSSADIWDRLKAVEEIVDHFEPRWRYPLAIYFVALIGRESVAKEDDEGTADDNVFFAFFRSKFIGGQQKEFNPSNFNVVAPSTMPEMTRVKELVREVHKDYHLRKALSLATEAEKKMRNLHIQLIHSEDRSVFLEDDPNEVLVRAGKIIRSRLKTIRMLRKKVTQAIS
ncbi:hypothetical protein BDW59DRAFT_158325 [Aspergillus cavernicola]|uniref:DUF7587 domain-containing protein n=1 Tax=Aspergillus cavernicola TaxID=176166 RepID=A0ABR4IT07_9EURO